MTVPDIADVTSDSATPSRKHDSLVLSDDEAMTTPIAKRVKAFTTAVPYPSPAPTVSSLGAAQVDVVVVCNPIEEATLAERVKRRTRRGTGVG